MINLKHIGIHSSSIENAISFYKDLLNFRVAYEFDVESELAKRIFEIESDFHVIMFEQNGLFIEVFVSSTFSEEKKTINHFCIELKNRDDFIAKCRKKNVDVTSIERGDRVTVFIKDHDGNLIEVKEQEVQA